MPLLWSGGFFGVASQGAVRVADSTLRPTDKDPSVGTPGLFSFGPSGASASISEGIKACFPPCAQKMRRFGWAPRFVQADALFLTLRFQFSRLSISMVKSPSLMR
jgi:hypothetical protein